MIRATRVTQATNVADALAAPGIAHARERWRSEPWHIDDPADAALIDRLARRWPSLAEVVPERPSRGVVTGCNRAFVIDAETNLTMGVSIGVAIYPDDGATPSDLMRIADNDMYRHKPRRF